ncbi:hypothetical protein MRX96_039067 [Rhipicephalus microplus]
MKGGWRSPKGNGARRYICESRKRNASKRDTQKKRKAHLKNRRRARGLKVDGCRIGLMRRGSSSLSVVVVHGGNASGVSTRSYHLTCARGKSAGEEVGVPFLI